MTLTKHKLFQHILVVINPQDETDMLLRRAIQLAEKNSSKITLFNSFHQHMPSSIGDEDGAAFEQQQQELIHQQVKQLSQQSLDLEVIISWQQGIVKAIGELVSQSAISLVIKSPQMKTTVREFFSTGIDNYLLRTSKLPLWLVKPRTWDANIEILAALDIEDESATNEVLNGQILTTGDQLKAELTIIGNNKDSNILDRILGDTALHLAENMPCDILILKNQTS
jgi:nucleotide-binding universal stress UspA family protein